MNMHHSRPPGFYIFDEFDGAFAELIGPLYATRAPEPLRFAFLLEKQHGNAGGNVHGGLLMTLADQVLGLTVRLAAHGIPTVTLNLSCDFVSSAKPGDWIQGSAEIVRQTRSVVFVRGGLWRGDEIVLSASGIWKKRNPPRT